VGQAIAERFEAAELHETPEARFAIGLGDAVEIGEQREILFHRQFSVKTEAL
jgi:hypothetical protein